VKYTGITLHKPYYDLYIDDKSINSEIYFASENSNKSTTTSNVCEQYKFNSFLWGL